MKFILNGDKLEINEKTSLNSGSIKYYEIPIESDKEWDGLNIEAVIIKENAEKGIGIAVINNKVFIDRALNGNYLIGFRGYQIENNEKTYQISTKLQKVIFKKGAGEVELENDEDLPSISEWEIYIAEIQNMIDGLEELIPTKYSDLNNDNNTVQDDNYTHTDNNFNNTYKENVDRNTNARHTHSNKEVLDKISSTDVSNWNNKAETSDIPTNLSELSEDVTHRTVSDTEKQTWNNKSDFSGSYNDLSNKPNIPSEVTENTVSSWGFTKNTGTYSKPSGGIPKTDLASEVQTSLNKAETALQEHQDLSSYVQETTLITELEKKVNIADVEEQDLTFIYEDETTETFKAVVYK